MEPTPSGHHCSPEVAGPVASPRSSGLGPQGRAVGRPRIHPPLPPGAPALEEKPPWSTCWSPSRRGRSAPLGQSTEVGWVGLGFWKPPSQAPSQFSFSHDSCGSCGRCRVWNRGLEGCGPPDAGSGLCCPPTRCSSPAHSSSTPREGWQCSSFWADADLEPQGTRGRCAGQLTPISQPI